MPKKGTRITSYPKPPENIKGNKPLAVLVAAASKESIKPARQAKPDEVKAKPKAWGQKISLSLDAQGFQNILDQTRLCGFGEGVKYIVTLAEDFLVKHKRVTPAWWIATLVTALHYEPPYAPPKQVKQGSPEPEPDLEKEAE